jgi:phage-related protein (TIGR01555 family)
MHISAIKKGVVHLTEQRQDGFENAFIGHGMKNKDPMSNFKYVPEPRLSDQFMIDLYIENSIARKIIDLPADESTKNWIEVDGDEEEHEELAIQMLDDLGAEEHFANALRWSRLFGGSAILILANDGGTFEDSLNEKKLQSIEQLRVYDKRQIFWNDGVLYDDPNDLKYGEPEYYEITPIGGMPFMVHESRLLLFKGGPLPEHERLQYQGWGLPVYQGMFTEILNNNHSHKLAILILERMSQAVLKLSGMLEILERDTETEHTGEDQIKKRLNLIDMARSILNTVAIDKEDEFELKSVPLSQLPEMLDRFGQALSAASGIPFTLLFGRSPAGMNATGKSDEESFYNKVKQEQKRQVKKPVDRIVKLLMLCKKGLFKGVEPKKWAVKFKPLWLPSDKDQAETDDKKASAKLKDAQADAVLVTNKIVSRAECRRKSGYTLEEMNKINGELKAESEQDIADTIGHDFSGG